MSSPIFRSLYINKIKPFIGKSLIKVRIGQRRVGKRYLLKQVKEEILKVNPDIQWVYINKESIEFTFIKTANDLHQYIQQQVDLSKETALFIDEIQDIQDFEQVLRDYCSRDSIDMYITGSNARLLSGELATYLTGRYIEFKIFSLSFAEFIQFYQREDSYSTFTN